MHTCNTTAVTATFTKDFIAAEQKVMVGAHMMCTLQATEKADKEEFSTHRYNERA